MKEVKIEIEQIDLKELGIDQPEKYAVLRFNESSFVGYWITKNEETSVEKIIFYIGAMTFMCKNTPYNVELFESIMK